MEQTNRGGWVRKFRTAFHGVALGVRGQSSFAVHVLVALLALGLSAVLRLPRVEWCLVLLCITAVFTCELMNSAIEHLAHALEPDHNPRMGMALDIASGAVLLASIGTAVTGGLIFLPHLWQWLAR